MNRWIRDDGWNFKLQSGWIGCLCVCMMCSFIKYLWVTNVHHFRIICQKQYVVGPHGGVVISTIPSQQEMSRFKF